MVLVVLCLGVKVFVLFVPYICFHILVKWPPIGKIAAHSAYDIFSWYMYLIVILVFLVLSHLGFWSGNLFLIAPFPDRYLLVTITATEVFFSI